MSKIQELKQPPLMAGIYWAKPSWASKEHEMRPMLWTGTLWYGICGKDNSEAIMGSIQFGDRILPPQGVQQ